MEKINSNKSIVKSKRYSDSLLKIKTEGNNFGIIKTFAILILFLLQILTMVFASLFFVSFLRFYMVTAAVITILTCIYVLSSNKNSQSKAVWIMFLIIFFGFGYIIFYLSDERFFFRRQSKRYKSIFERSYNFEPESLVPKTIGTEAKREVEYLSKVGKFSCYSGTDLKYYSNGSMLFDEILEECKKAEKFIFLEYFIISDGALLTRFENILKSKEGQGLDVRIIYDDMGSHRSFSRQARKRLKNLGVKIMKFNQLISWFSFGLNYRDHRKIAVIDGKVAFTGGANFADEYTNEKRMHGYWKDSGLKLIGNAVDGLTLSFLRQWEFLVKEKIEISPFIGNAKPTENDSAVVPFADGLDYTFNIGRDSYINLIANAKQKIYIMTPYLILEDTIFNLLKNKALAGVDVRLILPAIPDKKAVYRVSRNTAEKLAEFGVKLYTMNLSFVHSKIAISENTAIIGSINFDLRSFYQQFENAVLTNDKSVMKDVFKDFEETMKVSTQLSNEKFFRSKKINRIIAGLLGIISPFM